MLLVHFHILLQVSIVSIILQCINWINKNKQGLYFEKKAKSSFIFSISSTLLFWWTEEPMTSILGNFQTKLISKKSINFLVYNNQPYTFPQIQSSYLNNFILGLPGICFQDGHVEMLFQKTILVYVKLSKFCQKT